VSLSTQIIRILILALRKNHRSPFDQLSRGDQDTATIEDLKSGFLKS